MVNKIAVGVGIVLILGISLVFYFSQRKPAKAPEKPEVPKVSKKPEKQAQQKRCDELGIMPEECSQSGINNYTIKCKSLAFSSVDNLSTDNKLWDNDLDRCVKSNYKVIIDSPLEIFRYPSLDSGLLPDQTNKNISISFWFKFTSDINKSYTFLFHIGTDSPQTRVFTPFIFKEGNNLRIDTRSVPKAGTGDENDQQWGKRLLSTPDISLQKDKWYHYVEVHNENVREIYINGSLNGTDTLTFKPFEGNLQFSRDTGIFMQQFVVYGFPLSQKDVRNIYNTNLSRALK